MYNKLLHTPEGFRDIYGCEFLKRTIVNNLLFDTIKKYNYMSIETPAVEFFDVFSSNIGTIPSNELYKFFDKEGNTLVLRPDFTPSIARCAAKYFCDETMTISSSCLEKVCEFLKTKDIIPGIVNFDIAKNSYILNVSITDEDLTTHYIDCNGNVYCSHEISYLDERFKKYIA